MVGFATWLAPPYGYAAEHPIHTIQEGRGFGDKGFDQSLRSMFARRQTKYESHKSSLIYSLRNPSIAL